MSVHWLYIACAGRLRRCMHPNVRIQEMNPCVIMHCESCACSRLIQYYMPHIYIHADRFHIPRHTLMATMRKNVVMILQLYVILDAQRVRWHIYRLPEKHSSLCCKKSERHSSNMCSVSLNILQNLLGACELFDLEPMPASFHNRFYYYHIITAITITTLLLVTSPMATRVINIHSLFRRSCCRSLPPSSQQPVRRICHHRGLPCGIAALCAYWSMVHAIATTTISTTSANACEFSC
jgi:hypothetical protein